MGKEVRGKDGTDRRLFKYLIYCMGLSNEVRYEYGFPLYRMNTPVPSTK